MAIVAIVVKSCPEVGPTLFKLLCKSHCIATRCRKNTAIPDRRRLDISAPALNAVIFLNYHSPGFRIYVHQGAFLIECRVLLATAFFGCILVLRGSTIPLFFWERASGDTLGIAYSLKGLNRACDDIVALHHFNGVAPKVALHTVLLPQSLRGC